MPSLRSNYLRSSSAVSMESSNARSHNSSPSIEGSNGLNALFDNSNSDNDADYTPVMKKRKKNEIRIGENYQAIIPVQVSDKVPENESDYFEMPPGLPPGLPQPICHKLPNSNPNSHWSANKSAFQPVKHNNNTISKNNNNNNSPQSDINTKSSNNIPPSTASLSPHQSRLQKYF